MKHQTSVQAPDGTQNILITRVFDLPLDLLFKAFEVPELFEEWMGTKVLKMENKVHGSFAFETSHNGQVAFKANGTIHEFVPNTRITRTFQMENTAFPVQLEFLDFEALSADTSCLKMLVVFKSKEYRDQLLSMPFSYGINMAHDKLQTSMSKSK